MEGLDTWFEKWVIYHRRLNLKSNWPQPRSDDEKAFFGNWKARFRQSRVTEPEAKSASKYLATLGALPVDEHLRAIFDYLARLRRLAQDQCDAAERARQRQMGRRVYGRRLELYYAWQQLSDAQRDRLLAATIKEHPHLADLPPLRVTIPGRGEEIGPPMMVLVLALDRMVVEGLAIDPDPEAADQKPKGDA